MQDLTPPPCSARRPHDAKAASKETTRYAHVQPFVLDAAFDAEDTSVPRTPPPRLGRKQMQWHEDSIRALWDEQRMEAQGGYPCKRTFVHFQGPVAARARTPCTEPRNFKPEAWDFGPSTPHAGWAAATPSTAVSTPQCLPLMLAGEGSPCLLGRIAPRARAFSVVQATTSLEVSRPELLSQPPAPTVVRIFDLLSPEHSLVRKGSDLMPRQVRLYEHLPPEYSLTPQRLF